MGLKTSIEQEKVVFAYMLKRPQYLLHVEKDFFSNDDIQYIASSAREFFKEYKEAPSCEQMKAILKDDKKDIKNDTVESIYNVDIVSMDEEWLKDTTEAWLKWRSFNTNFMKAAMLAKTTDVSLDNVKYVVDKCVGMLTDTTTMNFDRDLGFDFFDVENHKSIVENKIPYTWEYFNKSTHGGLDPKTLTCYIGGTNVGKSCLLCNDAAEFVRKGKNTIYITCEMSPPKVARRIGCNLLDITTEEYDRLVENQNKVMQSMKRLINNSWCPLGKLFIKEFPTSQGTTLDVERYVKEIEETQKFKVDVVIIDYINILSNYRNPNDASNTYMKIKTIAEDLRGLAVKMDFVCITASQVGRSALNSSDINIEDVSESMGLMHSVDNALGIIMTDDMRVGDLDEDGKAQPYYYIKLLKIREGENRDQKFRVNANFSKMKFIEKTDSIDMLSHFK